MAEAEVIAEAVRVELGDMLQGDEFRQAIRDSYEDGIVSIRDVRPMMALCDLRGCAIVPQ